MEFDDLILEYDKKFDHGEFKLKPGESINDVVNREHVPDALGVYLIYSKRDDLLKLIYIGKSGTLNQDGTFKKQRLKKRLTMKQDGIYRKYFFQNVIDDYNFDELIFKWFNTYSDTIKELPGFIEANLLAKYFIAEHELPILNKKF